IGAGIYGYMPDDFLIKIAGPDNIFAVPVAAIVGIPLYIRAETAIPIAVSLIGKGMGVGTAITLIIGGAGMAIPEMSMLSGIFKIKLVAAIVAVIFITAVVSGFVFNLIL
ncbi:permease, partial [Escherichia coli]